MGIESAAGIIGERLAEATIFLLGFFIVKGMIKKKRENKCHVQQ